MISTEPSAAAAALHSAAWQDLPEPAREALTEFLEVLIRVAGPALECVLLFGSGAEGRLRPTSDLNVLVIAAHIDPARLNPLRESLQSGRAAAGLTVMFLESGEFADACESFAVKFADIKVRHRLLYGSDPFARTEISREASIRRLRQILLNLKLRLRERYALDAESDERLAAALADMTGPIRVGAATVLALRDGRERSPKAALEEFAADPRWQTALAGMSAVHRGEPIAGAVLRTLLGDVFELLAALSAAASALR
jgi:predicted nucleotidyltransferase